MKSISRSMIGGAVAVATVAFFAMHASAQTTNNYGAKNGTMAYPGQNGQHRGMGGMNRPGIIGTITAINGATITVQGRQPMPRTASTTRTVPPVASPIAYTVDASNAAVMKNNATTTLAGLALGDTVFVQGTVSGTNVKATAIRDGVMMGGNRTPGMTPGMNGTNTPGNRGGNAALNNIQGNGQPVIAGNISAIGGSTITVTNGNTSYTVDASGAKIQRNGASTTISSAVVGDHVIVQGTVNGSSVTAQTVIDQPAAPPAANPNGNGQPGGGKGFFGSIGQFFRKLFNF